MRRTSIVFLPVLLLMSLLAACSSGGGGGGTKSDEINIAVIQPLTGESAEQGKKAVAGIQLAAKVLNADGGVLGKKIHLIVQDDASNKTQTAALMRKYGADTSVLAVIGPNFSSDFLATLPLAEQLKVTYISSGSTAPVPDGGFNDWTFRITIPSGVFLPQLIQTVIAKEHITSPASMYAIDDASSANQGKLANQLFEQDGVKAVATATGNGTDTDFSSQVSLLLKSHPDLIAVGLPTNAGALFIRQVREAGYKGLIMATVTSLVDHSVYDLSHGAALGMLVPSPFDPSSTTPAVADFVSRFKAEYNEEPDGTGAYGFDTLNLLMDAAKTADTTTDRQKLRDALSATKYTGVTGEVAYENSGDRTEGLTNVLEMTKDGFSALQ